MQSVFKTKIYEEAIRLYLIPMKEILKENLMKSYNTINILVFKLKKCIHTQRRFEKKKIT